MHTLTLNAGWDYCSALWQTLHTVDSTYSSLWQATCMADFSMPSFRMFISELPSVLITFHFLSLVLQYSLHICVSHSSINQSIGMYRMWWFLAVLRSLFHSSLSYTFSCHSSPPTIFLTHFDKKWTSINANKHIKKILSL